MELLEFEKIFIVPLESPCVEYYFLAFQNPSLTLTTFKKFCCDLSNPSFRSNIDEEYPLEFLKQEIN